MSQPSDMAGEKLRIFGKDRIAKMPGELGIWVFIIGEMTFYLLFFGSFMLSRAQYLAQFKRSAVLLPESIALVNMILLLFSSLMVALGVRTIRDKIEEKRAPMFFGIAICCGLGFIVLKSCEFNYVLGMGLTAYKNYFFNYYWILSLLHLTHLTAGVVALYMMFRVARRTERAETDARFLESCGCFWHAVDLLWVVLFPMLYLMR